MNGVAGGTGIVVLNWNNARDTTACLSSLRSLDDERHAVYVVDNGSTDTSVQQVRNWCAAELGPHAVRQVVAHGRDVPYDPSAGARDERPSIVLVLGDENLGYAGGNNLGIRVALHDGCDQVWLLNNDTVVATDTLAQLLSVLRATPAAGVVGACILDYGSSDVVQCLGGYRYSSLTTARKAVGAGLTYAAVQALPQSERRLDYVSGASMLIPATTLRRVGLLAEEYFLYHEDVDYACRCRAVGLPLVVSQQARVYHKFGGTAGSSEMLEGKSALAAFHGARSTMILTRKFRPYLVPLTLLVRLLWVAYLAVTTAGRRLVRPTVKGLLAGLQASGSSTA